MYDNGQEGNRTILRFRGVYRPSIVGFKGGCEDENEVKSRLCRLVKWTSAVSVSSVEPTGHLHGKGKEDKYTLSSAVTGGLAWPVLLWTGSMLLGRKWEVIGTTVE